MPDRRAPSKSAREVASLSERRLRVRSQGYARAAFWSAAVGQPLTRFDTHPEYHGAVLQGQEFELLIQRLGDGPGRVHLDIHTDGLAAEIARLEELGAERVQQVDSWWILRDPAGLLFCVIPSPPGRSMTATRNAGTNADWLHHTHPLLPPTG